tara:strand:+ start:192 stop:1190 length:999 start_codon:yes stop_codon:yes gene_type:complete
MRKLILLFALLILGNIINIKAQNTNVQMAGLFINGCVYLDMDCNGELSNGDIPTTMNDISASYGSSYERDFSDQLSTEDNCFSVSEWWGKWVAGCISISSIPWQNGYEQYQECFPISQYSAPGGDVYIETDIFYCPAENAGCTDPDACNYNPMALWNDGSCDYIGWSCFEMLTINGVISEVNGITNDNCECVEVVYGCMNDLACNFNPDANMDDDSCLIPDGCTSMDACNFNPFATCDNGSCVYRENECWVAVEIGWFFDENGNVSPEYMFLEGLINECCECVEINPTPCSNASTLMLIQTINVLGNQINRKRGLQLEIYDDGSVEKKYLIK